MTAGMCSRVIFRGNLIFIATSAHLSSIFAINLEFKMTTSNCSKSF